MFKVGDKVELHIPLDDGVREGVVTRAEENVFDYPGYVVAFPNGYSAWFRGGEIKRVDKKVRETYHYNIYVCYSSGRESGAFSAYGRNYLEAANDFSKNLWWEGYNGSWRSVGRKKGNPKHHRYMRNSKGAKILLIRQEVM